MTKQEYLLVCLAEECAELQKAAMKAVRFGLDNGNPFNEEFVSNRDEIKKEFTDLIAITYMLEEAGIMEFSNIAGDAFDKINRVEKYMQVSRDLGILGD